MLKLMGSQRVRHDLATEQQQAVDDAGRGVMVAHWSRDS